jgi:hypothetical protein
MRSVVRENIRRLFDRARLLDEDHTSNADNTSGVWVLVWA